MAAKLFLEIVSPERQYVSMEVDEVYAPGAEGDLGILPDHTTFFCALRQGEFRYSIGGNVEYVALEGGFLEVRDNKVTVLADGAELGKDINIEEALRRKLQVEKDLEDDRLRENKQYDQLQAKLMRELLRLDVAGKYRK
jgi:F-type H+-transporting ATPase subunit epsilon